MATETLAANFSYVEVPSTSQPRPTHATSEKRTARLAGIFYLMVGIFGGFAVGYAEPKMYAAKNAALTAQTVLANVGLVRAGVVADLMNQVFFVLTAITLYALLRHVHTGVARAMVLLVVVAAAIGSLNAVFLFEGLQVANDPTYLDAFGQKGVEALVLLLVDMQHYGLLATQVFFGLWLAPLGYLAWKSGRFPKVLSGVLIVAAGSYMVDLLTAFLAHDLSSTVHGPLSIPVTIGEIWMVFYLLVIGVRTTKPSAAE